MKTGFLMASAAAAMMVAGSARADDAPPASPPNMNVYVGGCLHPAIGGAPKEKQSAILGGILATVAPALIGKAFDWVGARLAALGADKKTVLTGNLAAEPQFSGRFCVQVVRPSDGGKTLAALKTWQGANAADLQVPTDKPYDYMMELWVRPSKDGEAVSFVPTLLYYPRELATDKNGKKDTLIAVSASLAPVSGSGATGSWTLPKQTPQATLQFVLPAKADADGKTYGESDRVLANTCVRGCVGASPWYASPWADAKLDSASAAAPTPLKKAAAAPAADAGPKKEDGKGVEPKKAAGKGKTPAAPAAGHHAGDVAFQGPAVVAPAVVPPGAAGPANCGPGGADVGDFTKCTPPYAIKPINVSVTVTEIRSGSEFFATLAELYNGVKPGLETAAKEKLVPGVKEQASLDQMSADATSLAAFATALDAAEKARTDYCVATNFTSASAVLRAKQLAANVSAAAAHQPAPFANPIAVGQTKGDQGCPT